jgi:hypothetical protein
VRILPSLKQTPVIRQDRLKKTSLKVVGTPTEIRTEYLPCRANLLENLKLLV